MMMVVMVVVVVEVVVVVVAVLSAVVVVVKVVVVVVVIVPYSKLYSSAEDEQTGQQTGSLMALSRKVCWRWERSATGRVMLWAPLIPYYTSLPAATDYILAARRGGMSRNRGEKRTRGERGRGEGRKTPPNLRTRRDRHLTDRTAWGRVREGKGGFGELPYPQPLRPPFLSLSLSLSVIVFLLLISYSLHHFCCIIYVASFLPFSLS